MNGCSVFFSKLSHSRAAEKQPPEEFCKKKSFLKIYEKFTRNLCQRLFFNKAVDLKFEKKLSTFLTKHLRTTASESISKVKQLGPKEARRPWRNFFFLGQVWWLGEKVNNLQVRWRSKFIDFCYTIIKRPRNDNETYCSTAVAQRCSVKRVFLEILLNSKENTPPESLF